MLILLQRLEEKAEQMHTVITEHETKLASEIKQRKQLELKMASQAEEMNRLAAETLQLNETLKNVRKNHKGLKCFTIS
jgi:phosphoribosylaminoimidazole-succinocarboxamide synthase